MYWRITRRIETTTNNRKNSIMCQQHVCWRSMIYHLCVDHDHAIRYLQCDHYTYDRWNRLRHISIKVALSDSGLFEIIWKIGKGQILGKCQRFFCFENWFRKKKKFGNKFRKIYGSIEYVNWGGDDSLCDEISRIIRVKRWKNDLHTSIEHIHVRILNCSYQVICSHLLTLFTNILFQMQPTPRYNRRMHKLRIDQEKTMHKQT